MEHIYLDLKTGLLDRDQYYTYRDDYICKTNHTKPTKEWSISYYISLSSKRYINSQGSLKDSKPNKVRLSTREEIEHLKQCVKANTYVDYTPYNSSSDELSLLAIMEESKKLSNLT